MESEVVTFPNTLPYLLCKENLFLLTSSQGEGRASFYLMFVDCLYTFPLPPLLVTRRQLMLLKERPPGSHQL